MLPGNIAFSLSRWLAVTNATLMTTKRVVWEKDEIIGKVPAWELDEVT